jgi:hypothetical protein
MPTFGGSPYDNPQMGSFGGQEMINTGSPRADWMNNQQPAWMQNNQFFDPSNPGMNSYYNPYTNDTTQNYQGGFGFSSGANGPFSGAVSWTDRMGNRMVDPNALFGQFGGGGGGGYNKFQSSDYQGNPMTAPQGYGGGNWDVAQNVTNVNDVIQAYRPTMEANIGEGFAEAGNRLGQSGFAMSTPYAQELGDVERLARGQMNQRGLEYQYNAGQFDASNEMAAMMAQNQEKFGGWQQAGNWDMQAQGQNSQNDFNQWMAQNQWGFQDNQGENRWNQQNQQSQQQMLASLLGGF